MTGFGRAQGEVGPRLFTIELKSVNSRHLDLKLRMPPALSMLEKDLSDRLRERLDRGRVECTVNEMALAEEGAEVEVNLALARRYKRLFENLKTELALPGEIGLDLIVRQRDVLQTPQPPDPSQFTGPLLEILDKAHAELDAARRREGSDLEADLRRRTQTIADHLREIRGCEPDSVEKLRERLLARLEELGARIELDEQRFAQEVAYIVDRADITEEIVRLESHMDRFLELLDGGSPVGRKLDFLIQEFNREANTIASKASNSKAQHLAVEIKSEIERMREQIQNIE